MQFLTFAAYLGIAGFATWPLAEGWTRDGKKRGRVYLQFLTFAAYLGIAGLATWPLAAGLTRDVAGNLGDPLLSMWAIGWGARQIPRLAIGAIAFDDYWHANIFHPHPFALAFAEPLAAQSLQVLPVYALSGNLILAYNLLLLSTFILCGFAMYLLVRDLLGERDRFSSAAFVAGLVFAFAPVRLAEISHLPVLSTQWLPFALYGVRRYVTRGNRLALAGGAVALLLQNWSCADDWPYAAAAAIVFACHQLRTTRPLRSQRAAALAVGGIVVALGTWPLVAASRTAQAAAGTGADAHYVVQWFPGVQASSSPAGAVMLIVLAAAVAAGYVSAALIRRTGRAAAIVGTVTALVLMAAASHPTPINEPLRAPSTPNAVKPPARVQPAANAPAVYHILAAMPDNAVVLEFPFGDPAWDVRYVYYSTVHWKALVNGYGRTMPADYTKLAALLQQVAAAPDEAWRALRAAGTTHVVLHEHAMTADAAAAINTWLTDHFAVEIARFDGDLLFDVSGAWPPPP